MNVVSEDLLMNGVTPSGKQIGQARWQKKKLFDDYGKRSNSHLVTSISKIDKRREYRVKRSAN